MRAEGIAFVILDLGCIVADACAKKCAAILLIQRAPRIPCPDILQ